MPNEINKFVWEDKSILVFKVGVGENESGVPPGKRHEELHSVHKPI